jgi:hypothetical protein
VWIKSSGIRKLAESKLEEARAVAASAIEAVKKALVDLVGGINSSKEPTSA